MKSRLNRKTSKSKVILEALKWREIDIYYSHQILSDHLSAKNENLNSLVLFRFIQSISSISYIIEYNANLDIKLKHIFYIFMTF